uniref:Uncharacterized protein n=1 Tax=Hucho hucho TaxID=62062 RepID=A0A4W5N2L6_9TELE
MCCFPPLTLWLNGFNSTDEHVGFIASARICVSQRKVLQIDDPVQRLLVQLHNIIYITQLPPALQHSVKRRAIERFKKSLFHYGSSPYNLKVELNKLLQGVSRANGVGLCQLRLVVSGPVFWRRSSRCCQAR